MTLLLNLTHHHWKSSNTLSVPGIESSSYYVEFYRKWNKNKVNSGPSTLLVKRFAVVSTLGALWVVENLLSVTMWSMCCVGHEEKWSNLGQPRGINGGDSTNILSSCPNNFVEYDAFWCL